MNLITTVIGFGMSATFIVFVCTRLICGRIRGDRSRPMYEIESRIDLEQVIWVFSFLYFVGKDDLHSVLGLQIYPCVTESPVQYMKCLIEVLCILSQVFPWEVAVFYHGDVLLAFCRSFVLGQDLAAVFLCLKKKMTYGLELNRLAQTCYLLSWYYQIVTCEEINTICLLEEEKSC